VDDGSEFKGPFKTHFSYFFKIHTHEAGRHRSQGLIEARNKILGKIIFRFQQIQELHTGEQNTEWVRYLRKIIQAINKHYKETPEVIDSMHHLPRADGDSRYVYPIGTRVRRQLDNPKGMNNEKLFGRWRSTDYRWDQKISTVTSVYMAPDSPVLYQLDNNDQVGLTKNQLQLVDDNEQLPERVADEKYVIEKLVKRFKKNSKIYFTVKWKGYEKITDEPRSELIKDAPLLVKAFEDKL
jgi:hypothetical protein